MSLLFLYIAFNRIILSGNGGQMNAEYTTAILSTKVLQLNYALYKCLKIWATAM